MREEVVTSRLTLRPIALIVNAQNSERPSDPTRTPTYTHVRSSHFLHA